jgi:hypothetical protein
VCKKKSQEKIEKIDQSHPHCFSCETIDCFILFVDDETGDEKVRSLTGEKIDVDLFWEVSGVVMTLRRTNIGRQGFMYFWRLEVRVTLEDLKVIENRNISQGTMKRKMKLFKEKVDSLINSFDGIEEV